jgi:hypothetical protein
MQLVALSAFCGRCENPTQAQTALIERWFWSSSFAGWFTSGNPALVRRLLDELRDRVARDPAPTKLEYMALEQTALATPLRFDLRTARVRVLLCVLLALKPRRPNGDELSLEEASRLLLERGFWAMSTLCATVKDDELRSSPANRILDVAPETKGQAKTWILQLDPAVRDEVLLSHGIPPDSFPLLENGDNDGFLRRRSEWLAKLEHDVMRNVNVTPPTSNTPSASPIDADDASPLD